MVAETLTATRALRTRATASAGMGGNLKVAHGSYTIAAAVEAGDIFEMCLLPAGATVIGGYVQGADIDTGTEALDFDVGWAANGAEALDADGFGDLGTITGDVSVHLGAAGIYMPFQGVLITTGPKTFTKETVVQITVNTASNAGHVGIVTVVVFYTVGD